ncbi:hypothetical protein T492DRAFT_901247 [Pavlovales sp. CCMP2436]|nr:hypothetical protein T492DRAFT_901247 [Pavlovales sp. CCMP2436]
MPYSPRVRPFPLNLAEDVPVLDLGERLVLENLALPRSLLLPRQRMRTTAKKPTVPMFVFDRMEQLKVMTRVLWRLMREYQRGGRLVLNSLLEPLSNAQRVALRLNAVLLLGMTDVRMLVFLVLALVVAAQPMAGRVSLDRAGRFLLARVLLQPFAAEREVAVRLGLLLTGCTATLSHGDAAAYQLSAELPRDLQKELKVGSS